MPYFIRLIFILIFLPIAAQAKLTVTNISPSNWWVNLHYNRLVIVARGTELSNATVQIPDNSVRLLKTSPSQNPNYLLLDIEINNTAKPGIVPIHFIQNGKIRETINFQLQKESQIKRSPIDNSDVIYQIIPDRFRDANPENNNPKGYFERLDKKNPSGIHGGDIQGINNSIDYISNMGFSAVELKPVYESNQFFNSYDHCGITNFYNVDERLGSISDLQNLTTRFKSKNIKTIISLLFNQMGKQNELVKNNPFPDWTVPDFKVYSPHQFQPIFSDPYASTSDLQNKYQTWQDMDIASVNQSNESLRKFLIQHSIWWIQTTKADAIHIEKTYMNSSQLLTELFDALNSDFPGLTVITDFETAQPGQANYLRNKLTRKNLSVKISDNSMASKLSNSFSSYIDYNDGTNNLYHAIASDYSYSDPHQNITFLDSWNLSRVFSNADKDPEQLKMMLFVLFSLRGTPQLLYGTEALLEGISSGGLGFVRNDMPGISSLDIPNIFSNRGLRSQQQEIIKHIQQLITIRKNNNALTKGSTKHYIPEDGFYALFRKYNEESIMILVNNHTNKELKFEPERFSEDLEGFNGAIDLINEQTYSQLDNIIISSKKVIMLKLTK